MFIEIGSYEAKTKLPELLREVQAGQCFHHHPPWKTSGQPGSLYQCSRSSSCSE